MYTFPLKYNKIQGQGHAFIFGASFLRFCIKVRLMINSRKCILQNVKNKKCNVGQFCRSGYKTHKMFNNKVFRAKRPMLQNLNKNPRFVMSKLTKCSTPQNVNSIS